MFQKKAGMLYEPVPGSIFSGETLPETQEDPCDSKYFARMDNPSAISDRETDPDEGMSFPARERFAANSHRFRPLILT